ncbi:MAG: Putative glycosyltransferase EpsF [Cryomorphaceae bacterium]|nr:MAG: Putative glycosyltransferase EpsF [Cryomorphaceae bacterium]
MDNKKTYLVITPFFPSKNSFVGSYIFDQINEIRNQSDFNIKVIKLVSAFSVEKDYKFEGFEIMIFRVMDLPWFISPGIFNELNTNRFKSFLKNKKINDIIISHAHVSYPASYLQNILDCKKIVQHHGLDVLQLLNGRSNFIMKLQKNYLIRNTIRQLNHSDLNIGVSELVLSQLREYPSYSPKDELVLYNGVDTSKFYPIKGDVNRSFTIGSVANFWEIKDQITLIKAIELLILDGINDIQLKLIGTGKKLDLCKKFVKDHNLSEFVIFEKERAHNLINSFYNEIDLFVLPSYYEALGCVYLESWSTNTPFIAIKCQGISELIPDYEINNLLADEKSPSSLKEKILGEYKKKRSFPFDEKYDIKNTIKEFMNYSFFTDIN